MISSPPLLVDSSTALVQVLVILSACLASFLCIQHEGIFRSSFISSSHAFDAGDVVDMERRISLARVRLSFLIKILAAFLPLGLANAVEVVGHFSDFEDGAGLPHS